MAPGQGKICALYGCSNYNWLSKRSFFSFPKEKELCAQWIVKARRSDLDDIFKTKGPEHIRKVYRVCDAHFRDSDFRNPNQKSQGLHKGTVPSVNLHGGKPNCIRTSHTKRKRLRPDAGPSKKPLTEDSKGDSNCGCPASPMPQEQQSDDSSKDWYPGDRAAVCSKHFVPTDYKPGLKIRRLLPEAVPSVFNDYPSEKQAAPNPPHRVVSRIQKCDSSSRKVSGRPSPAIDIEPIPSSLNAAESSLSYIDNDSPVDTRSASMVDSKGTMSDASVNTNITAVQMKSYERKLKSLQQNLRRHAKVTTSIREKLNKIKNRNHNLLKKLKNYSIQAIEEGCIRHDTKAEFLRQQLLMYQKKKGTWDDKIVRYCVLWRNKSIDIYNFMSAANLLTLPSRSTLQRYVGSTSGENVNSIIKQRLVQQCSTPTSQKRTGSIVVDEMAIEAETAVC